ncbi:hypothetical protein [Natronoarchaeum rubrum]|uniref:hypothetical protein n=1 Tax=Natronoarchaeum rubrum TaxID=755311 RepID=UPI00211191EB|nr:hypothetical protein [Natronoarchaeum rubrum]
MGAPAVSEIEDPELYHVLEQRDAGTLCRVFNHFGEQNEDRDPTEYSSDGWRRVVAGNIPKAAREWLETRDTLSRESVDRVHAAAYLNENYEPDEELRDPDSLYELAILIHELGLSESLTEIIVAARVRQNELKRTWTIDQSLNLTNLQSRIEDFHKTWNNREEQSKAVLVRPELAGESAASLHIFIEKGAGVTEKNTFSFRQGESNDEIPTNPSLTEIRYREVKDIRLLLQVDNDDTKIIFTDDYSLGWNRVLDVLFDTVFNIENVTSSLERETVVEAEELHEEAAESISADDEPIEQVTELIRDRSKEAKMAVENTDYSEARKDAIKAKLDNIELSGSEIEDDPNLETEEFRLIGRTNLDEVFVRVDIETSFLRFLQRADEESLALVMNIDGRHVTARTTGPQPVDGSRLGSESQIALKHFFGYPTSI